MQPIACAARKKEGEGDARRDVAVGQEIGFVKQRLPDQLTEALIIFAPRGLQQTASAITPAVILLRVTEAICIDLVGQLLRLTHVLLGLLQRRKGFPRPTVPYLENTLRRRIKQVLGKVTEVRG